MAWVERSGSTSWRVRYRRDDGTIGAITGFATKKAAKDHAETLESDQRTGTWIDPAAGKITLREWSETWLDAIDVAAATDDFYRSMLRSHLLPVWGDTALTDISGVKVAAWAKRLRERYKPATVAGAMKTLSLLMADAVDERLIVANPIRTRRRGRHTRDRHEERLWATCEEVLAIADNAARLPAAGPAAALLIVTAAWTGARWGELTGLQRRNVHLDDDPPTIVIDPRIGALHETSRGLHLGPPKTAESARTITLPPFLAALLRTHLASHTHSHVFIGQEGELHRRSNFGRRAMRPAADGNHDRPLAPVTVDAVKPGLVFHGLRHSHKTWMIADNIPEIAQSRRLGHTLSDKIQQTYSHVATEVEHRILDCLQQRWGKAVSNRPEVLPWRDRPAPRLTLGTRSSLL